MVEEGMTLTVPSLSEETDKSIVIPDVLFIQDGKSSIVGTPTIAGASVTAAHDQKQKAKKIRVATYKSKSRYRRVLGHRQPESVITIKKISLKQK